MKRGTGNNIMRFEIDPEEEKVLGLETPGELDGAALVKFESDRLEKFLKDQQEIESHCFVLKRNPKNVPMFLEYCRLSAGNAFGEQALLKKNEPMLRAATIKCTRDCHFAVMNKESF
jgi:CRP-like cAMP-binding protein